MDFLAAIRRESELFYAVADGADPTVSVPTCPGWSIADLACHLGEVHCVWGTITERAARRGRPDGERPQLPGLDHRRPGLAPRRGPLVLGHDHRAARHRPRRGR